MIGYVVAMLIGTPVAAGRFHRSPRIGGLVAVEVFDVWIINGGLEGFRVPGR